MKPQDHPSFAPMAPGDAAWGKVAAAYRDRHTREEADEDSAPFGFAQRVVAQAMALQRRKRLSWWTRWSLRAALGALMVAAAVVLRSPPLETRTSLLEVPDVEIPRLSSL
jgi:hypothetical protein